MWVGVAALAIVSLAAAVELARGRRSGSVGLWKTWRSAPSGSARVTRGRATTATACPNSTRWRRFSTAAPNVSAGLLGAERALAADASHQLRSPLTALSIRLEEIVATSTEPAVREEATAALVQAERLAAVVDSLLAEHSRSARSESGVVVAVDAVLAQQEVEWDPAFRRAGRRLVRDGSTGLWRCRPQADSRRSSRH